ncbi:MAG: hypothetical protein Harvfovirus67_9 [Harvfovirus sp.]|uniref:Uncharacterized protein n=1 Tax=Harvfovirus sp. TaxID=2487768 RepID=A0A3G5A902_9VIRU|nr:MAG: hypothetical protein Harvfovirus67_9 [Harvfovirus sp.]
MCRILNRGNYFSTLLLIIFLATTIKFFEEQFGNIITSRERLDAILKATPTELEITLFTVHQDQIIFNITVTGTNNTNQLAFYISRRNYNIDDTSEYYILDPNYINNINADENLDTALLATYSNNLLNDWFAYSDEFTTRAIMHKKDYYAYNETTKCTSITRIYRMFDNIFYEMKLNNPFNFLLATLNDIQLTPIINYKLINPNTLQLSSNNTKIDHILLGTLILYNRLHQQ